MDKIEATQKTVRGRILTCLSLLLLSAILIGVVVAFRSVHDVYFDVITLLSSGGVVFFLLLVNYIVVTSFGKGDAISSVFIYSVLLITAVSVVICLHFGFAYAIPLSFLPLLLGTDFHKKSALATHFTSIFIAAVYVTLFSFQDEEFPIHEISLRIMILVVNGAMGTLLIYLIKHYASRLNVLFTAAIVVLVSGVVGFLSAAAMGDHPDVMEMITVGVSVIVGGAISVFA